MIFFPGGPETHPDIFCGGRRNQYQSKITIKSDGTVFLLTSLGLNSLPRSCVNNINT